MSSSPMSDAVLAEELVDDLAVAVVDGRADGGLDGLEQGGGGQVPGQPQDAPTSATVIAASTTAKVMSQLFSVAAF